MSETENPDPYAAIRHRVNTLAELHPAENWGIAERDRYELLEAIDSLRAILEKYKAGEGPKSPEPPAAAAPEKHAGATAEQMAH